MGKNQNDSYMFEGFFRPYLEKVKGNIIHTLKIQKEHIDMDIANCKRLLDDIYANLFKLTIRALIRELHIYKKEGLLKGETKEERFAYFEKLCEKQEFRLEFFRKYLQLESLLDTYVDCLSENLTKIISDVITDKLQIEKCLRVKVNQIRDISIGKGDTHNGGKTVAIIYFDECKIVYKPHSLKADVIFTEIVNWINKEARLEHPLKVVTTLSMNDRGWQECIEHLPCEYENESHSYYYKMGCFLALFYALGTTDLHFENIIACKDNPMFIDLETILTNNRVDKLNTVLDTGLLPQVTSDFLIDVDISGICGKSNKSEKMKMMVVINRRTDEMMVDEVPAIVVDRQNLVYLNGKTVKINDYSNDIIDGYQTVTDFLVNSKEKFLKILDTLVNKNDMFRTVLRHTQVYSKYLSAALHPDYLVNSEKRLELFQRLMSNCKNEHEYLRVNDEIATLMIDDVPYYMFDYYSKDLYSGNGLVSRNYFAHSAREICVERMKRLEEFKIANVDLIQKSLFTAYIDDSEAENYIVYKYCRKSSNREECIKFANRIADSIFCLDDQQGAIFFINGLYNNT